MKIRFGAITVTIVANILK